MKATVYIVKGSTMGPEGAFPEVPKGTVEWQFSDGPSGQRGSSADYIDLRKGLEDHRAFNLNTDEADFTADEQAVFDGFLAERAFWTAA